MRRFETWVFGAPLEVLQEKCGSAPLLHFFPGAKAAGDIRIWQRIFLE
jgi:hypothetical protein